MLLPFSDTLKRTTKFDAEMAQLFDGHYSRQTHGSPQFMPPGYTCVLRDNDGLILFGWLYQKKRDDHQVGLNCSVFHNASNRLSSEIIKECETFAFEYWIPRHRSLSALAISRMFTYIDPSKLKTTKRRGNEYCKLPVGRCFVEAGWARVIQDGTPYVSPSGLFLFEKFH